MNPNHCNKEETEKKLSEQFVEFIDLTDEDLEEVDVLEFGDVQGGQCGCGFRRCGGCGFRRGFFGFRRFGFCGGCGCGGCGCGGCGGCGCGGFGFGFGGGCCF